MALPTGYDILLKGTVGSTAYGLAHEGSDIDKLGVYRVSFRDLLGLDVAKAVDNSYVQHEPDITLHEVGKYLLLALKANPTILELLWLSDYDTRTTEGELIRVNRRNFLSERAVRGAYGAYAKAQADRLMRRRDEGKEGFGSVPVSRVAKHARHCARLLYLGHQLLTTGQMRLDVSHMRDELFE